MTGKALMDDVGDWGGRSRKWGAQGVVRGRQEVILSSGFFLFCFLFISHCHRFFSFFSSSSAYWVHHTFLFLFFFCSSIKCYGTANEPCGSMSRYDVGG